MRHRGGHPILHPRNGRAFVVVLALGCGLIPSLWAAGEMSQDELRMKERVIALSQGEGSVADLRIEGMDGGMASFTHFEITDGKVVRKRWETPGLSAQQGERAVTHEEIRALLKELVAKEYWTFKGTRFIPDANTFLFRFYDKDLQPVDYRCDAEEYRQSPPRSAIRAVLLNFVSDASPAAKP